MKKLLRIAFVIVVLGALAGLGLSLYLQVYPSTLVVTDAFVSASSVMMVSFLMILILRYLSLICFAFLEHMRQVTGPLDADRHPLVTVILPAYNEGPVIEASIHSAMKQNYPNYEVIVVNDGSTDDTYSRATALVPQYGAARLRVLTQANGGKASALNRAISFARGELIVCSDADSRLDPDSLRNMAKHFADPRTAAVAGSVKVANRVNMLTKLQALEYIEGLNLVRAAQSFFGLVGIIPGPIGMFRRSVLEELGGYRSDTYAEDCDLTFRIMLAGGRMRYENEAVAWTEAPEDIMALFKQRYRWGRGILQAMIKHKSKFLAPFPNFAVWANLWLLLLESIGLPTINFIAILFFVLAALGGGLSSLIFLWWAQLTILDAVVALYCVAREKEDLRLVPLAVLYRLYFIPYVDVMRFFAWLDELFDVRMGWMRLQRLGRI
jgi:poly-beta-1,6 N-acetyl-D-glucosamine synthase